MLKTLKIIGLIGIIISISILSSLIPCLSRPNGSSTFPIYIEKVKDETRITVKGKWKSYKAFTLKDPARVVVDLKGGKIPAKLPKNISIDDRIISQIRIGKDKDQLRLVLDSAKKDEIFHFNITKRLDSLQIRCWRAKKRIETISKREPHFVEPYKKGKQIEKDRVKDLRRLLGIKEKVVEAEKKEILKFRGPVLESIDFYKEDLHNVFRLFGELTGKNFIVDDTVKGSLTLSLRNVPWDLVMDIISDMKDLKMEHRGDVIVVRPKTKQKEKGELVVKPFPEEALYPATIKQKKKKEIQRSRELTLKAYNLEKSGKIREALKIYEKAYLLSRTNIELAKKNAYLHYIEGNYARSYFYAKEALKLNTQDSEAALYAALSASKIKRETEAQLFFEASINGIPKIPEAFFNYGIYLEEIKNYSKAIYIFNRYEELFGPSLDVSLEIAKSLERSGKMDEACKKYREITLSGFKIDNDTKNLIKKKIALICKKEEKK